MQCHLFRAKKTQVKIHLRVNRHLELNKAPVLSILSMTQYWAPISLPSNHGKWYKIVDGIPHHDNEIRFFGDQLLGSAILSSAFNLALGHVVFITWIVASHEGKAVMKIKIEFFHEYMFGEKWYVKSISSNELNTD